MILIEDKSYLKDANYSLSLEKFYMSTAFPIDRNYYSVNDGVNGTIGRAYPFSNENLDAIFKNRDLSGKKVLTVGSSGDQLLYSIFAGAKQVSLIDANVYAKPYIEYKLAAIQALSFEEFNEAFDGKAFDWKIYQRISHLIPQQSKTFWDNIFMEYDAGQREIRHLNNELMSRDFGDWECKSVFYRDEQVYNELQRLIPHCQLDYIVSSFYDFPEDVQEQQFDLIYLSNIRKYVADVSFNIVVNQLYSQHLNAGGEMMVDYFYRNSWFSPDSRPLTEKVLSSFPVETTTADGDVFYMIKKPLDHKIVQNELGVGAATMGQNYDFNDANGPTFTDEQVQ